MPSCILDNNLRYCSQMILRVMPKGMLHRLERVKYGSPTTFSKESK